MAASSASSSARSTRRCGARSTPAASQISSATILSSRARNDAGRPPVTGRPSIGSSVVTNGRGEPAAAPLRVEGVDRRAARRRAGGGASRSWARSSSVIDAVAGGVHHDHLAVAVRRYRPGSPGGGDDQHGAAELAEPRDVRRGAGEHPRARASPGGRRTARRAGAVTAARTSRGRAGPSSGAGRRSTSALPAAPARGGPAWRRRTAAPARSTSRTPAIAAAMRGCSTANATRPSTARSSSRLTPMLVTGSGEALIAQPAAGLGRGARAGPLPPPTAGQDDLVQRGVVGTWPASRRR